MPAVNAPPRPGREQTGIVAASARLAESNPFNFAIFGVIVANAIVLGLETYDRIDRDAGGLLDTLNWVFLGIFAVELAIRMTAHGSRPQDFFKSGWNVFDFLVVMAAITPGISQSTALLRLARLARIVRIVRIVPDLRILTVAIGRSLPGVGSLSILAVLLVYVYGMIGWLIYGDEDPKFETIGDAMLTLFILLSLENLPDRIETGLLISDWTVPFYVSFALIAAFLLLNILIGVVIESMEEARTIEEERHRRERREAAAATATGEDDNELAIDERVASLRRALTELEAELKFQRRES